MLNSFSPSAPPRWPRCYAEARSRSTDHREPRRVGLDHGAVVRLRTHAVSAEEGTAADREAFIEGSTERLARRVRRIGQGVAAVQDVPEARH